MRSVIRFSARRLVIFCLIGNLCFGQTPTQQQKPADQGDVVQLSTTVIQTSLMVFAKDGRFVNNLKQDLHGVRKIA